MRTDTRQPRQGLIEKQQLLLSGNNSDLNVGQAHALKLATMFLAILSAGILDEYSPHRLGSGRKEMATRVPVLSHVYIYQPHVRLMHQRCGLERLVRLLLGHLRSSQLAQFLVDERQELLGGRGIAGFNLA